MQDRLPRRGHQKERTWKLWTPFRVRQLANLRERGYTSKYIANMLGITEKAVLQAAQYYALPKLKSGRPRKNT